jgi:hypothetical protein
MNKEVRDVVIGWALAFIVFIIITVVLSSVRGHVVRKRQHELEASLLGTPIVPFHSVQTGDIIICAQPARGLTPFHLAAVDHVGIVIRLDHMDQILVAHARFATPCVVVIPLSSFANIDQERNFYVRRISPALPVDSITRMMESVHRRSCYRYDVTVLFDFTMRHLQSMTTLPSLSAVSGDEYQGRRTYCTHLVLQMLEDLGLLKCPLGFVLPEDFIGDNGDILNANLSAHYQYLPLAKLGVATGL